MFRQDLPLAVRKELDRQGLNGIPVLLSTNTDLTLSGQPRRQWIVATRDNVAAVTDGDDSHRRNARARAETSPSSARRARSAPASCRPTSTTTGSTWPAIRTHSADRFHRVAGTWKTSARPAKLDIETDATATDHPLPEVRPAAADRRRSLPALPAAQGDPRPAVADALALSADGGRHVRPDARGAWPMELAPPKLQQYLVDHILNGGDAAPDAPGLLAALLVGRAGAGRRPAAA